jgi:hypothetical protein
VTFLSATHIGGAGGTGIPGRETEGRGVPGQPAICPESSEAEASLG